MILFAIVSLAHCMTCPHTRGDDPTLVTALENIYILVPIRVGMILFGHFAIFYSKACPHTRGDDPFPFGFSDPLTSLSPYAWG